MREDIKKIVRSVGIIVVLATILLAMLTYGQLWLKQNIQNENNQQGDTAYVIEGVKGLKVGGPFILQRQDGRVVTDRTYEEKFRLMFFGFTHCPDICPGELSTLSRVLEQLSPAQKEQLHVLFISVDPERDTVEQMAQYMSLFHPDIEGLSGRPDQIEPVLESYKIYAQKIQTPEMSDYTMDHTANIYLFDPYDKLVAIFKTGVSEQQMLDILNKVL